MEVLIVSLSALLVGVLCFWHLCRVYKYGEEDARQRRIFRYLKKRGRYAVISALAKAPKPVSEIEICESPGIKPGAVYPALSYLRANGLATTAIAKIGVPTRYSLNDAGRQLFEKLQQAEAGT